MTDRTEQSGHLPEPLRRTWDTPNVKVFRCSHHYMAYLRFRFITPFTDEFDLRVDPAWPLEITLLPGDGSLLSIMEHILERIEAGAVDEEVLDENGSPMVGVIEMNREQYKVWLSEGHRPEMTGPYLVGGLGA